MVVLYHNFFGRIKTTINSAAVEGFSELVVNVIINYYIIIYVLVADVGTYKFIIGDVCNESCAVRWQNGIR